MMRDTIAEVLKRPFGDNKPISIQEVTVTHVNGNSLPKHLSGRAVLQLNPKIRFSICFDNFRTYLLSGLQNSALQIRTHDGVEADGFLQYSLNDTLNSKGYIEAQFIPKISPMLVISPNSGIKTIKLGVINFIKFYGKSDQWVDDGEKGRRVGSLVVQWKGYRIQLMEQPGFSEKGTKKTSSNDYDITHTGTIERIDGKAYSVSNAEDVLHRLRAYLCFVCGGFSAIAPVAAIDSNGRETAFRWGTTHVDSWRPGKETWLPFLTGGDVLTQLLPRFFDLYDDPKWKNTISAVVDWYINGNNSATHVAIILYQAALEAISSAIYRKKGTTEEWLRLSLASLGVDTQIPGANSRFKNFSDVEIRAKKVSLQKHYTGDGPEAIVEFRNDLIHSRKNYAPPSIELQIEAKRLARWYIEIMLLKTLKYSGEYFECIEQKEKTLK